MSGYNGWTNYETWNANLWYGDYFAELAAETEPDIEAGDFARTLEDVVSEDMPDIPSGFYSDVLSAATSEVNWYEIAETHLLDVVREDDDEDEDTDD